MDEKVSMWFHSGGAVIAAFSIEEFLAPNDIFDGGVVGVAMILANLINVKLGILMALLNIPFRKFLR